MLTANAASECAELVEPTHKLSIRRDGHQPGCPIHGDQLAGLDLVRRLGYANDGRNAVLPRDHRAMGVRAAHLHHQAAGCQEQRSPAGIGRRCDQDLAGLQVRPTGSSTTRARPSLCQSRPDCRQARRLPWRPQLPRPPARSRRRAAGGECAAAGSCWYASRRSATSARRSSPPVHAGRHQGRGRRHHQRDRSSPRRRARARPPSAVHASRRAP